VSCITKVFPLFEYPSIRKYKFVSNGREKSQVSRKDNVESIHYSCLFAYPQIIMLHNIPFLCEARSGFFQYVYSKSHN
jgi:hypothetical protein